MAKRLRKQISRALKRRFHHFENQLLAASNDSLSNLQKDLVLSYNEFSDKMRSFLKRVAVVAGAACVLCVVALALSSCNVTRKVTTESSYFQKGDTSCTIIVKTVESYDATKKLTSN